MTRKINREKCEVCQKQIYMHNTILVCNLDNKIYHAHCLNISTDVALELQQSSEWFCPCCLKEIFPFFDCNVHETDNPVSCYSCCKLISTTKHLISYCTICTNICHASSSCLTNNNCTKCYRPRNEFVSFDPYPDEDNDRNLYFDYDVDNTLDTIELARSTLNNCAYHEPHTISTLNFNNGISFYFSNIDGFKSNFSEFRNQHLNCSSKFDFYCFSETNLKSGVPHNFYMDDYNCEMLHSIDTKSKGSGLALYYRKNLAFSKINYVTVRNNHFETLGGKLKCDFGFLYIIVIYRFNNNIKMDNFHNEFAKIVEKVSEHPCVILGDFNFDVLKSEQYPHTQKYIDNFMSNGFSPLISKPTHFTSSSSTCIDQIWCNLISSYVYSGIINDSTSTHRPIFACIPSTVDKISNESDDNTTFIKHNISLKNIDKFNRNLSSYLDSVSFEKDPNISKERASAEFSNFYSNFKNIYESSFTEKTDCKSKRNFIDKPWINISISKSCKTKNKLHNIWIKSRGTPRAAAAEKNYKSYRSKLRDIIKNRIISYFKKRFDKCSGYIKKCWKVLNEMRHKNRTMVFPNYIEFNNSLITSRRFIVTKFNEYFVNIANKLNSTKSNNDFSDFKVFLKNSVCESIFLNDINPSEIDEIIKDLNPSKSSDISPKILKIICFQISPVLSDLFNNCMYTGIFPDELKIARVIPLFKSGDPNEITNYRPISLLPVI